MKLTWSKQERCYLFTSMTNVLSSLFLSLLLFWPWHRQGYNILMGNVKCAKFFCFLCIHITKAWDFEGKIGCQSIRRAKPYWLVWDYEVTIGCLHFFLGQKGDSFVCYYLEKNGKVLNENFARVLGMNAPVTFQK